MFFYQIEDSDRLMNLVLGRLSKDWIGLTGVLDKKNGSFLWILDRTRCGSFFGFPKKEKLTDTGFFPLVFRGSGLVTYWTVWFFLDTE